MCHSGGRGSRTAASHTKDRSALLPTRAQLGTPDCQPHEDISITHSSTFSSYPGKSCAYTATAQEQQGKPGRHLCGERAVGKMRMERASVYMDPAMDRGLAIPLICLAPPCCAPTAPTPLSPGDAARRGSCTINPPMQLTFLAPLQLHSARHQTLLQANSWQAYQGEPQIRMQVGRRTQSAARQNERASASLSTCVSYIRGRQDRMSSLYRDVPDTSTRNPTTCTHTSPPAGQSLHHGDFTKPHWPE